MNDGRRLPIALAVIFNRKKDKVLLSKRPEHVHLGGLWEFPGGKVFAGESTEQALRRELYEELGVLVQKASPLLCFDHDYPDLKLRLDVWTVEQWRGRPEAREGQEIEWLMISRLKERRFPPANQCILSLLI